MTEINDQKDPEIFKVVNPKTQGILRQSDREKQEAEKHQIQQMASEQT